MRTSTRSLTRWRPVVMTAITIGVSSAAAVALIASPRAVAPAKVELCHRTGNGSFNAISVSDNALATHLGHGDVLQPNGLAPGGNGAFDSACNVISWTYGVNAAPDTAAQDPLSPGNLFVGSGIPATLFGTARNLTAGIELGMMVLYRQGPNVASLDDYADGVLNFAVNSGPQSVANGSSGPNAGRAAWNFTFSVATGLGGATTDLNDFTFQLLYDVDPGPGTVYRTLTLEPGVAAPGKSGFQWRDVPLNLVFINDDEGNVNVTQNSENYAFSFFQGFPPLLGSLYTQANAFTGPAQFDLILQAFSGPQLIARNHIVVNVGP